MQDQGNGQNGSVRFALTGLDRLGNEGPPVVAAVPGHIPNMEVYRPAFELTDADGRPVRGAPPHGPLTELAQFDAHRTIPGDVAAIRQFWAPTRYKVHS